ncbi:hypothetical protein [Pelomicrobium methylotrophicum]|nr:hypothetical protein [Pelomicrobium methylotrophicum]
MRAAVFLPFCLLASSALAQVPYPEGYRDWRHVSCSTAHRATRDA